ncbi:class IV lanthionine synthetase LanL [Streptomyces sp. G-G2]|uniref:class IV lanthionine synthetase LanL n=1 Tax=Streptomyces sp. G-G2 TaxID=3046201 RepID=UPI0024B9B33B|nr:class IV lanthionine synthetase LanL [Streptomyces sp. G-G2]MDJ0384209.1 class IV lanthionine synthetase LanL [Streptomyces sp. G-G2]
MPAVDHGWKLHLSARPDELAAVTALVLPVLRRHVCHAKYAKDPETLRAINSGVGGPGVVGKAITVYPLPGTVAEIGAELVGVLRDREGPQVVSDRRIDPRSPVYYRYGPFTGEYRTGRGGRLESVMTGPDGQLFDGLAVGAYRCPPWAEDPFPTAAARTGPAGGRSVRGLGGGRYEITAGIVRTPQGNVYRALDRSSGRTVVVKQARAFVSEDPTGTDSRDRLRNERGILAALAPVTGVPRGLDYFRHQPDEYLVMSDCGDRDLRRDVQENGPYADARPPRSPDALPELATRLLRIVDEIHGRGVVIRDLKPNNVVLDGAGLCHVIDFGISELNGVGPRGATPGYSAPVLRATGPAAPADDYYALGATLCFAATGLDPVIVDTGTGTGAGTGAGTDAAINRDRTLEGLAWALPGRAHGGLRAAIGGLMSFDPAVRTSAAAGLRTGTPDPSPASRRLPRPLPRPRPRLDDVLLQEVIAHTAEYCVAEARRIADPELAARSPVPTPIDVYGGSSGLGLELLHHTHRPGVPEAVDALARWTADQSRNLSPGFYAGRAGVDLFLAEAGVAPAPAYPTQPALPTRAPDGGPPEADLIEGVAGIGVGRLLLARGAADGAGADAHVAVAAECQRMLTSGRARLTPAGARTTGSAALDEGLAHGGAGVAYFLLEFGSATGDPEAVRAAEEACARLASVTPDIIAAARAPGATRRYGSWCRGLAGIGTVLVRAADRLGEPAYLTLAQRSARTCATLAPRMPLVGQCCGLSGVGDLMLDLAGASSAAASEEFRRAAETIALIILTRSGGPRSRPTFPDTGLTTPTATWATGSAGVLSFLRRLHTRTTPRLGLIG